MGKYNSGAEKAGRRHVGHVSWGMGLFTLPSFKTVSSSIARFYYLDISAVEYLYISSYDQRKINH
jgi:hypothetical protein